MTEGTYTLLLSCEIGTLILQCMTGLVEEVPGSLD